MTTKEEGKQAPEAQMKGATNGINSKHQPRGLLLQCSIALITGFAVLLVEYLFVKTWRVSPLLIQVTVTSLSICSLLFLKEMFVITIRQRSFFREDLSLAAFLATSAGITVSLLSFFSGQFPWALPERLVSLLSGSKTAVSVKWTDYALLLCLTIVCLVITKFLHSVWAGRVSTIQRKREQRGEEIGFFLEGAREWRRRWRGEQSLQDYIEPQTDLSVEFDYALDTLPWADRARELIRLSSPNYHFDLSASSNRRFLRGKNTDSSATVLLYPIIEANSESLSALAEDIQQDICRLNLRDYEVIVIAAKTPPVTPSLSVPALGIRFETEASLLSKLVDFTEYFQHIEERLSSVTLPDSSLTLKDVYVPSRFYDEHGDLQDMTVERYLSAWLEDKSRRHIAVLGEYGQGKSTAALMWTHRLLERRSQHKRIPILIELRGTSPRNLTPLQMLAAWSAQFNINPRALLQLHSAGRLILILEGFDEMSLAGDAEMRLEHFRTIWRFACPQAKILMTGRPNFFFDHEEQRIALGISKNDGTRPYCEPIRLAPFTLSQIDNALRSHPSSTRRQICRIAKNNSRFLDLVSRPCLLHIVAVLWERESLFAKADKLSSAIVMDLFLRHTLSRQAEKASGYTSFMALTTNEREFFMKSVAAWMVAIWSPNQISGEQLNTLLDRLVGAIPDSVSRGSSAISGETTKPIMQRVAEGDLAIEQIRTDVRACGLLVDDPSAPGTFRFGHKSFMEYLIAKTLFEKNRETAAIRAVTGATLERSLRVPEVRDFLAELILESHRDCKCMKKADPKMVAFDMFKLIFCESERFNLKGFLAIAQISSQVLLGRRVFRGLTIFFLAALLFLYFGNQVWPSVIAPPLLFVAVGLLVFWTVLYRGLRPAPTKVALWLSTCQKAAVPLRAVCSSLGLPLSPFVRNFVKAHAYVGPHPIQVEAAENDHEVRKNGSDAETDANQTANVS